MKEPISDCCDQDCTSSQIGSSLVLDSELSADDLDWKYNFDGNGEHPVYSQALWRDAVASEDTFSGYWIWVAHQLRS